MNYSGFKYTHPTPGPATLQSEPDYTGSDSEDVPGHSLTLRGRGSPSGPLPALCRGGQLWKSTGVTLRPAH